MPVFTYQCLKKSGEIINGKISAEEETAALLRLRNMGLSIIELNEDKSSQKGLSLFSKKVTLGDLSLFSRQLSTMLGAGIPLTRSLFSLSHQVANPVLKGVIANIANDIEGGMTITGAIKKHPKIFSNLFVAMINAGEMGGTLEQTLKVLSIQLEKEKSLNSNIKSATFYPKIVVCFAALIFLVIMVFLVPVFQKFIPEGASIPFVTKMVFSASHFMRNYWYIWILGLAGVFTGLYFLLKNSYFANLWDNIKFKMPIFGSLIYKTVVARFSRTLSTLIDAGIPIVQALDYAGPVSGSKKVVNAALYAGKMVQEGKTITEPLQKSDVFQPMVIHMISVGEETGSLSSMLNRVAEFYEEEVEIMTRGLVSIIEPLMVIIVGLLIGGILISLYLPIFSAITKSAG